jgi:hypothetical protein
MPNGRVVMLVDNGVRGDSRVQKAARSAAAAGWDVTLLGCVPGSAGESWELGGAQVRLLPLGGTATPSPKGVKGRLLARGGAPLRVARLARRPVELAQVRFYGATGPGAGSSPGCGRTNGPSARPSTSSGPT